MHSSTHLQRNCLKIFNTKVKLILTQKIRN